MHRIAPPTPYPIHEMSIGYLRDTLRAINAARFDMPDEYAPTLDTIHLARWEIEYRPTLARCTGYRGDSGAPRFNGDNPHTKALEYFDRMIELLRTDKQIEIDTHEAYTQLNNLEQCQMNPIKYLSVRS